MGLYPRKMMFGFSLLVAVSLSQGCAMKVMHFGERVTHVVATECLSCHGPDQGAKVVCSDGVTASHPVYLDYPPAGKEKSFHGAEEIEAAGLRLEKGQISCISCHDLQSTNEKYLAVDNRGSRLCLTCHIN